MAGIPRNFEVYDPLDFLAEVTQHIPNKGEHQIRYYGWYSNKKRGMRKERRLRRSRAARAGHAVSEKCRMTWAALIKCVYEVDPLKCPKCGGQMKIISFIEQNDVIEKILQHCGLWKDPAAHPPPLEKPPPILAEPMLDYGFFEQTCL